MEVSTIKKNSIMVGIAQYKESDDPAMTLVAPHLGSCLGVAVFSPTLKKVAMVHCLLPLAKADPEKAKENPYMYVDTGVSSLLQEFMSKGIPKSELVIYVAGGGNINDDNGVFEIGKNNFAVLRKLLWKNGLLIKGECVGGNSSKTIFVSPSDGKARVKIGSEIIEL